MNWRPLHDAPTNGTEIMLCVETSCGERCVGTAIGWRTGDDVDFYWIDAPNWSLATNGSRLLGWQPKPPPIPNGLYPCDMTGALTCWRDRAPGRIEATGSLTHCELCPMWEERNDP